MAQYLPGIALPKGDRLQRLRCEETSERQAESRWFPVAQVHPQLRGMQIGSIAHNGQARHRGSPPHSEDRSEEHTSELQSLMRISYAVFCLKKKKKHKTQEHIQTHKH